MSSQVPSDPDAGYTLHWEGLLLDHSLYTLASLNASQRDSCEHVTVTCPTMKLFHFTKTGAPRKSRELL